eukprot:1387054-Amorphochlora_amoeboformis.AAC.1
MILEEGSRGSLSITRSDQARKRAAALPVRHKGHEMQWYGSEHTIWFYLRSGGNKGEQVAKEGNIAENGQGVEAVE